MTYEDVKIDLNLPDVELAQVLGVSRQTLWRFEKGGFPEDRVAEFQNRIDFFKKKGYPKPSHKQIYRRPNHIHYANINTPVIPISAAEDFHSAFTEGNKELQKDFQRIEFPTNELSKGLWFTFVVDEESYMDSGMSDDPAETNLLLTKGITLKQLTSAKYPKGVVVATKEKIYLRDLEIDDARHIYLKGRKNGGRVKIAIEDITTIHYVVKIVK